VVKQGRFSTILLHRTFNLIPRAASTFCQIASGMMISIGDFLRMGSDDIVKNMYDVSEYDDNMDNVTRLDAMLCKH
jgi:hypothetical protein